MHYLLTSSMGVRESPSRFDHERQLRIGMIVKAWAVTILCCIAWCFMAANSYAGSPDAAVVTNPKTSTSQLQFAPEFSPQTGVYYYDVFIRSMRVGKLTIKTEKQDEAYSVEVKGHTRRAISALYKVRYRGEVKISPTPVRPASALIEEQSGGRNKEITVHFPSENVLEVTEKKSREGEEPREKQYTLESESFILDPFSTILLVRALEWEVGIAEVFDVFSGDKRYELRLLCVSESQTTFDGRERDVWKIVPEVNLPEKPEETRLANFEILLSKDKEREILLVTGDSKAGKIRAEMRKFEPLP